MARSQQAPLNYKRRNISMIWPVAAVLLALPTALGAITHQVDAGVAVASTTPSATTLVTDTSTPEPIVMETLTGRSVFTDSVSFDLTSGCRTAKRSA